MTDTGASNPTAMSICWPAPYSESPSVDETFATDTGESLISWTSPPPLPSAEVTIAYVRFPMPNTEMP